MAWGPEMLKQMLAAFSVKPGTELEEEDAGGAGAGPSGTLDMTGSPAGGAACGTAATGGDGGRAGNGADGGAIGDSLAGDSLAGDGSPGGTATTGASPAADHSIGRSGGTTHYTTCIAIVGSCLFINSLGERMDVCVCCVRSFRQLSTMACMGLVFTKSSSLSKACRVSSSLESRMRAESGMVKSRY